MFLLGRGAHDNFSGKYWHDVFRKTLETFSLSKNYQNDAHVLEGPVRFPGEPIESPGLRQARMNEGGGLM
jgi:hypothetical protein